MWLAAVEAPQEIEDNDAVMSHFAKLDALARIFSNITANALVYCLWNQTNPNVSVDPLFVFLDFLESRQDFTNNTQLSESELELLVEVSGAMEAVVANLTLREEAATADNVTVQVSMASLNECAACLQGFQAKSSLHCLQSPFVMMLTAFWKSQDGSKLHQTTWG